MDFVFLKRPAAYDNSVWIGEGLVRALRAEVSRSHLITKAGTCYISVHKNTSRYSCTVSIVTLRFQTKLKGFNKL